MLNKNLKTIFSSNYPSSLIFSHCIKWNNDNFILILLHDRIFILKPSLKPFSNIIGPIYYTFLITASREIPKNKFGIDIISIIESLPKYIAIPALLERTIFSPPNSNIYDHYFTKAAISHLKCDTLPLVATLNVNHDLCLFKLEHGDGSGKKLTCQE
ncbi:unnamed protein product [Gordionus sp. m RMFG-2023]